MTRCERCLAVVLLLFPATLWAQPANDGCDQPTVVPDLPFAEPVQLDFATPDGIPGCVVAEDAWFYWSASASGTILVRGQGFPFADLSVYEVPGGVPGVCPTESDRIVCSSDGLGVSITAGNAYYFQVGQTSSHNESLVLDWFPDACEFPEIVSDLPFSGFADLEYATTDGPPGCPLVQDAWFYWEPSMSGQVRLESDGLVSIFEMPVGSLGVCPGELDRVLCAESYTLFSVTAGLSYFFQLGKELPNSADRELELEWVVTPSNDACASPSQLMAPVFLSVDFLVADDSVPGLPCAMTHDLWFEFTVPSDGWYRIEVQADAETIALYDGMGPCSPPATLLSCGPSPAYVLAAAGQSFVAQCGTANPSFNDRFSVYLGLPPGVPDDRYIYKIPGRVLPENFGEFEFSVLFDTQSGVQGAPAGLGGWSYGVCIEPTELELLDLAVGSATGTVNGGSPAGFHSASVFPGEGFAVGVVVSLLGINRLEPGTDLELDIATAQTLGPIGSTTTVSFCDSLGAPPVQVTVVPGYGAGVPPLTTNGVFEVGEPAPLFSRGDCNADGVQDIADAVRIIDFLFPNGSPITLECTLACDVNDDETVDIADAVSRLTSLFGTPPTSVPFPVCGLDPTMGTLTCDQEAACP